MTGLRALQRRVIDGLMAQKISNEVLKRIREALGPSGVSDDTKEIAPHLCEWRNRWHGKTPLLVKPANTDEVSRVLAICSETKTPVVPQGGNTGLVGGQIPTQGEILLSLQRMTKIRAVSPSENAMEVEAGAVLRNVQLAAEAAERSFPLSLAAEGACTIGGNVSTNAGGINVLRYGMTRDLVLGLEVVLADGRILDLMRGLRKDNTGYDLKQIFIGAEGTLGIITAAILKLFPKVSYYATVFASLSSIDAAVPLLNKVQASTGNSVIAFELIPRRGLELVLKHIPQTSDPLPRASEWSILMEISGHSAFDATKATESEMERAIEDGLVVDAVFSKGERDRQALWRLRESISEARRLGGASITNDISVQLSKIPALITNSYGAIESVFPGAIPWSFGHVGDGNIHLAVCAAKGQDQKLLSKREEIENAIFEEVDRLGGSISAEHGLGLAKNEAIAHYKSTTEIDLMRVLKSSLDPNNILNPGKVLPVV
jgi:FAD/FMN-containing dehydrogenase